MKHLKEIFNYIIDSILIPISDVRINTYYSEGTIISSVIPNDKNHGRKYLKSINKS